jgi:DNA-nicking Smr family endonuclease
MSFATQTTQTKKKVQDYVNQISSDWDTGRAKSVKNKNERRRRATMDALPADSFIEIKLVDSVTKEETKLSYGLSMPLKALFKKYAEDRNLNLRQLRFSYEGRTLFLSSVGNKSPQDLGIENLDSIVVTNNSAPNPQQAPDSEGNSSSDESKASSSSSQSKKEKRKGKYRKQCRRASWAGPEILGEEERLKLKHSQQLSRVFTEVAPQFEQIRQKLNAMNLACTPPKVKKSQRKVPLVTDPLPLVNNPCDIGVGGKPGVPFYNVHVGEADNLYKITKPLQGKSRSIDLHGMTKEEALKELDDVLPKWVDIAMRGTYPWVIPAVIICGGGNQILSEAVDQWIKCNDNVAKAPKNKFRRRRCTM